MVASVSSVIALILTLFILYQTFKLRNRYLFLIRTPQLVTQLEEHNSNISKYLNAVSVYQQELAGFIVEVQNLLADQAWRP